METTVTLIGGEGGRAMSRGQGECREKEGERTVGTRVPLEGQVTSGPQCSRDTN